MRKPSDHLGKELSSRFAVCILCNLSMYAIFSVIFHFCFKGSILVLSVTVPPHCLLFALNFIPSGSRLSLIMPFNLSALPLFGFPLITS